MLARSPDQQQLRTARLRFLEGEPLPPALVPGFVARSWERSRQAGLLPWQPPRYEAGLPARNVRQSPADRLLYQCVHEEMEQLWSAFGGPDWAIFCANPEGVVLHARQSPGCQDTVLRHITPGRRLAESDIGTTAPGCVLNEGAEAIVRGNQHYLAEFEHIFCLSLPLMGIEGQVIGALDMTGRGQRDASLLLEQARIAALSAETRLLSTLRHCHLLRVHHDPRWLSSPLAGVLAFEEDGRLRAASSRARRMLGLPDAGPVRSWRIESLFGTAPSRQRRQLMHPRRPAQRMALADGSHLWIQHARPPQRASSVASAMTQITALAADVPAQTAPAPADTLRHQSLLAIAHALRAHGGNMVATARHLGISRTTLYAKLAQLRRAGLL